MITLTLPFRQQLQEHSITRRYQAIVYHNIREEEGTIDAPIGRDPKNRLRNAINYDHGKPAVTHYKVIERFGKFTWIERRKGRKYGEDTSDPRSYGICQASAFRRQPVRSGFQ